MKKLSLLLGLLLLASTSWAGPWVTGPVFNAANVDINGGTVDGTVIGDTTPAKGVFSPSIAKGPAASTSFAGTISRSGTTLTFSSAADAILAGYSATSPVVGTTVIHPTGPVTMYITAWLSNVTATVDSSGTLAAQTPTSVQLPIAAFVDSSGVVAGYITANHMPVFISDATSGNLTLGHAGRTGNITLGYNGGHNVEFMWPTDAIVYLKNTTGVNKLTIDTTHNILTGGITSAGTSAAKNLVIGEGTAPTTSPADAASMWVADQGGVAGKAALFMRDETGAVHTFGENVGIGTTAPTSKLTVEGNTEIRTGGYLRLRPTNNSYNWDFLASGNDLLIYDGGTARHIFQSGGNVGIGTTAPGTKLDVNGTSYFRNNMTLSSPAGIYVRDVADTYSMIIATLTAPQVLQLGGSNLNTVNIYNGSSKGITVTGVNGDVSTTGTLTVSGTGNSSIAGNVGIGTISPGQKLDIVGNIALSHFATGSTVNRYIGLGSTNGELGSTNHWGGIYFSESSVDAQELHFITSSGGGPGTEKMTILANGNVGIWTTDLDGTPAVGRLTTKGSTNDGSTMVEVWRDSDEANVASLDTNGNFYTIADVSALTFTDRTPYFDGDALTAIKSISGTNGEIDHATLPAFAQKTIKVRTTPHGAEVALADAYESIDVEEDEKETITTVDAEGKETTETKPIILSTKTVDKGYKVVDGQVVRDIVEEKVTKKITKQVTQLRKDVRFDAKTGKFFQRANVVTEIPGRDIGAMVSILTKAVQELSAKVVELEKGKVK